MFFSPANNSPAATSSHLRSLSLSRNERHWLLVIETIQWPQMSRRNRKILCVFSSPRNGTRRDKEKERLERMKGRKESRWSLRSRGLSRRCRSVFAGDGRVPPFASWRGGGLSGKNETAEEEERFGTAVDTLGTLKKSSTYAFQPANFRGYLPHTWQPCVKCGQNCDWRTVLAVVPRRDNRDPNWPRLFTRLLGIVIAWIPGILKFMTSMFVWSGFYREKGSFLFPFPWV